MEVFEAPLVRPDATRVDGLAFIGLSLSRNHYHEQKLSNPASVSRQTQFDFNAVLDRNYDYFAGTSDDGWLVGGGESGESFTLQAADSAHVELTRIGSFKNSYPRNFCTSAMFLFL